MSAHKSTMILLIIIGLVLTWMSGQGHSQNLTEREIRAAMEANYFEPGPAYGKISHDGTRLLCPLGRIMMVRGSRFYQQSGLLYVSEDDVNLNRTYADMASDLGFKTSNEFFATLHRERFEFRKRFEALFIHHQNLW